MSEFKIGDRVRITRGPRTGEVGKIYAIEPGYGCLLHWVTFEDGEDCYLGNELILIAPTYKPGDVVRLEQGDSAIEGPVDDWNMVGGNSIVNRLNDGWTLKVIKEAPEPLPTEPGHYVSQNDEVYDLTEKGRWFSGIHELDPTGLKLTRLVPEGTETPGRVYITKNADGLIATVNATYEGARAIGAVAPAGYVVGP